MRQTKGKAKRFLKSMASLLSSTQLYQQGPFSQKEYEGKAHKHMFDN